jgi:hypothetical protein
MQSLGKFLERIKNSLDISSLNKEGVQTELRRITQVLVDVKDIDIKKDVLWIKTNPTRMTEIKLNEEKILEAASRVLNQRISKISFK